MKYFTNSSWLSGLASNCIRVGCGIELFSFIRSGNKTYRGFGFSLTYNVSNIGRCVGTVLTVVSLCLHAGYGVKQKKMRTTFVSLYLYENSKSVNSSAQGSFFVIVKRTIELYCNEMRLRILWFSRSTYSTLYEEIFVTNIINILYVKVLLVCMLIYLHNKN